MSTESYCILRWELWWRVMPLMAAAILLAISAVASGRVACSRVRFVTLTRLGAAGTSELEFALAFPVFLVSVLVTVQVALMVNANLIVDYAAFCAARSAVVWIPREAPGEGPNQVSPPGSRSEKRTRIERAAVLAVTPISPRLSRVRFGLNIPRDAPPFTRDALADLAALGDAPASRQTSLRMGMAVADKWAYASYFTTVDLLNGSGSVANAFDRVVTARVTHDMEMAVPFAGPMMGMAFGHRYLPFVGGYCVPISAAYTLALGAAAP